MRQLAMDYSRIPMQPAYRAVLASDADLACAFRLQNASVTTQRDSWITHHRGCREMSKEMSSG